MSLFLLDEGVETVKNAPVQLRGTDINRTLLSLTFYKV